MYIFCMLDLSDIELLIHINLSYFITVHMNVIAKGAEATISLDGKEIVKERAKKGYRLQQLDEVLRKKRNRAEAQLMREARRTAAAPGPHASAPPERLSPAAAPLEPRP